MISSDSQHLYILHHALNLMHSPIQSPISQSLHFTPHAGHSNRVWRIEMANDYLRSPQALKLVSPKPLVCPRVNVGNINAQTFQSNSAKG
jgi:hypothetical protein